MSELILIVDDEKDVVRILEYNLQKEGYRTRSAMTGNEALAAAWLEPRPALILLDLMLPDISGIEVCRQLRADPRSKEIPILMVTAKGEEIDRVVGFEVGADDYVVKPFFIRELLLRVRVFLRRSLKGAPEEGAAETRFGSLSLDMESRQVWVAGEEVRLTFLEFQLLATLMERKGRVQSRSQLLDDVWDVQSDVQTRTVDAHINRLREKLGSEAGSYIETHRGVGYRFLAALPEDAH